MGMGRKNIFKSESTEYETPNEIFSRKTCQDCFFFEYLETSRILSLVDGHCKLLELIHNKRVIFCSGLDVCKEEKDYHTLESQLTEKQKEWFNELYERRLDHLRKLDVELERPYDDPDNETREIAIRKIVIELKKLGTIAMKFIDYLKLRENIKEKRKDKTNKICNFDRITKRFAL